MYHVEILNQAKTVAPLRTNTILIINFDFFYPFRQKLLPLEKEYQFHDFHSPALDDPDFDAKYLISTSL